MLTNTLLPSDWDLIALQEPAINKISNRRANAHWGIVYPTTKYTDRARSRVVEMTLRSNTKEP